jgi:hypothetical protein
MQNETIKVINTESGQTMDVVVLHKHVNKITVVIGKGIHNVQCDLVPTKYKQSYAGSVMGREIVYNRSCEQVQADLDAVNPALKVSRKFKK